MKRRKLIGMFLFEEGADELASQLRPFVVLPGWSVVYNELGCHGYTKEWFVHEDVLILNLESRGWTIWVEWDASLPVEKPYIVYVVNNVPQEWNSIHDRKAGLTEDEVVAEVERLQGRYIGVIRRNQPKKNF